MNPQSVSAYAGALCLKGTPPAFEGFTDVNKSNLAKDRDGGPVSMA